MSARWIILPTLLLAPELASACTVCFGGPETPGAQAMGIAIAFLLAVLGTVFLGAAGFVYCLARRARSPLPDPRDFTAETSD